MRHQSTQNAQKQQVNSSNSSGRTGLLRLLLKRLKQSEVSYFMQSSEMMVMVMAVITVLKRDADGACRLADVTTVLPVMTADRCSQCHLTLLTVTETVKCKAIITRLTVCLLLHQ